MQDYSKRTKLSIFLSILEKIKEYFENKEIMNSYIFCLKNEKIQSGHNTSKEVIKLNMFCFNPGIGFNEIMKFKPFSIILTSGTLAPFDILEDELKVKFDITLENEHIIDKSQFKFAIIKGIQVKNKKLYFNFEYNNRSNLETIASLGITILNLCKSVKSGGILVYFTSFKYLNECYDVWGESHVISNISKYKKIFFDNKNNKNLINEYKNNENKNSILFSVFRGVSSEGIDYKDDYARMVVCVGVPYASVVEDKIQLKKQYLDKISKENKEYKLNGKKWYINDAISNVNQSLGRVLRHKNDYGALICIDQRYQIHYKNKLFSKWIRDKCEIIDLIDNDFLDSLVDFYDEQDKKFKEKNNNNEENNEKNNEKKNENNYQIISPSISLKEDENDNINTLNEEKHKNIFERKKREIKYEFEEVDINPNKEDNLINNKNMYLYINLKEEENDDNINNNIKEKKNNNPCEDNIFKRKKKEIKYEFEEEKEKNIFNINNEIHNEKEVIDDLMNKYLNINNSISNKSPDLLCKKTKLKLKDDINNEIDQNYNNEDINPNQLNTLEKKVEIKNKKNSLEKRYLLNKNKNYINEKNKEKEDDFDTLFKDIDNYKFNQNINDLNKKETIENVETNLNNNINIKKADEEILFCVVCYKDSKENPSLVYSISKCNHILCNKCWALTLKEKFECPMCKKKVREKTLTRLIKKSLIN